MQEQSPQSGKLDEMQTEPTEEVKETSFVAAFKTKYSQQQDFVPKLAQSSVIRFHAKVGTAHIKNVDLSDRELEYAGIPHGGLTSLCPNIVDLNISHNQFKNWEEILPILYELPFLQYFNITNNCIQSNHEYLDQLKKPLEKMENLVLNRTNIALDEVLKLTRIMPALKELHVCNNNYTELCCISNDELTNIQCLRMNNNDIKSWSEVWKLRHLGNLQSLILSGNPLLDIFYTQKCCHRNDSTDFDNSDTTISYKCTATNDNCDITCDETTRNDKNNVTTGQSASVVSLNESSDPVKSDVSGDNEEVCCNIVNELLIDAVENSGINCKQSMADPGEGTSEKSDSQQNDRRNIASSSGEDGTKRLADEETTGEDKKEYSEIQDKREESDSMQNDRRNIASRSGEDGEARTQKANERLADDDISSEVRGANNKIQGEREVSDSQQNDLRNISSGSGEDGEARTQEANERLADDDITREDNKEYIEIHGAALGETGEVVEQQECVDGEEIINPREQVEDREEIDNPCEQKSKDEEEINNPCNPFRNLHTICLTETNIHHWQHLDALTKFPSLKSVRLKDTRLYPETCEEDKRHLLLASLPNIEIFNGSEITSTERESAEIFYIRHHLDQTDKPHRVQELEKVHGTQSKVVDVFIGWNSPPFPNVHFYLNKQKVFTEKIDVKLTVWKLRKYIVEKMDIKNRKMTWFHFPCGRGRPRRMGDEIPVEEQIFTSNMPLSRYDIYDDDEFHVELFKGVVSRDERLRNMFNF